jgi:hypothetical protein
MRALTLIPLLILAACSDNAEADQKAKAAADTQALKMEAGQWETTTEITKVTSQDNGTPVLKAETTVASSCVGASEGKHPPAITLAGMDKAECSYDNIYMSRGRLNATISCKRPDMSGKIMVSADGTYTATTFETASDLQTYLPTDGDVNAAAKISGKRIGACAPPAAAPTAA